MKNKKYSAKIILITLVSGLIFVISCKNQQNNSDGERNENQAEVKTNNENASLINKNHIIGSWEDTSESALHFSLFANGTAQSDNMKTLLYKKWRIESDQIIFTVESLGNGSSSIDEDVYEIQKLNTNILILKKGNYLFEYKKI